MQGLAGHSLRGIAAVGAILAAETVNFAHNDWVLMIERLGLAVALVLFFVWTGWMREQRMARRMDYLEKENAKLATKVASLTEQVNAALSTESEVLTKAMDTLASRTCYAFRSREDFDRIMEFLRSNEKGSA